MQKSAEMQDVTPTELRATRSLALLVAHGLICLLVLYNLFQSPGTPPRAPYSTMYQVMLISSLIGGILAWNARARRRTSFDAASGVMFAVSVFAPLVILFTAHP